MSKQDPSKLNGISRRAKIPGATARDLHLKYQLMEKVPHSITNSVCHSAGALSRIGFLTTWNQRCGLATYAAFLVSKLEQGDVTILAEHTREGTRPDEENVVRCWTRYTPKDPSTANYEQLLRAIDDHSIGLLHLNCQSRFFAQPAFSVFIRNVQSRGVKVVVHLHNLFTCEESLKELVRHADAVVVHAPENSLEAIANGVTPERVFVVPHGVQSYEQPTGETKVTLRRRLGLGDSDAPLITAFGFLQPHKGMEAVLEAVLHLKSKGIRSRGVIIGETRTDDPSSSQYACNLEELIRTHGLSNDVEIVNRFVPDEAVGEYLAASDLVVMNYRSGHYEASGACSLAVGAGAIVMASLAPAMTAFSDAVWHLTSGYPPGLSAEILLTNHTVRAELERRARAYAERNSWAQIASTLRSVYRSIGFTQEAHTAPGVTSLEKETVVTTTAFNSGAKLRILIQNRPSTFTMRGGDTVVIERLVAGLEQLGCSVVVDVQGAKDPRDFDLVHLFNFATPDLTRQLAHRAHTAGVPFVVTTLCEDVSSFHMQSHAVATRVIDYSNRGQDREWWWENRVDVSKVQPCGAFDNVWTAQHAAALFSNGASEGRVLKRLYPNSGKILEVKLGHEVAPSVTPDLFQKEYGLKDFVFCVGRFESRKNQLMLLKALETSDLPVVLASGGFSYQPEYDAAVRGFKRKGKTVILGRVSAEMLASAYASCRVHALPSWYELPGLVSLEAAAHGKNVVVTRTGTSADYLGDKAFYCSPSDEDSIYSAVMAAYYSPVPSGLADLARSYTWDETARVTLAAYHEVLGIQPEQYDKPIATAAPAAWYDSNTSATEFQDALERGELAAKNMDFDLAHELLAKAEAIDPTSARALKARGAVWLAQGNIESALVCFDRALTHAPQDPKVLSGRGMCEMLQHNYEQAVPYFESALRVAPDHLVALHQLLDCAYRIQKFDSLSSALKSYLEVKPDDAEMRFCYAGALHKQGDDREALQQLERVLSERPDHGPALELKMRLVSGRLTEAAPRVDAQVPQAATVTKPIFSGSMQDSLAELSQRVTEWRVNSEEPKADAPQSSPGWKQQSPQMAVASQSENSSPSVMCQKVETVIVDLEREFAAVEEAKRERDLDKAKQALEALQRRGTLSGADKARAGCLEAEIMVLEGDLVGADMLYDIVLKDRKDTPRALCGKGALAAEEQRFGEARDFFERALSIQPNYDVALAGIGLCEMAGDRAEGAFQYFLEAARINPENNRAILGVLQLGYPLRKFAEIETVLEAYLEAHPASIDMLYSFAGVLYAQGKIEAAKSEAEKILIFEPANERALELKKMISERGQASWSA